MALSTLPPTLRSLTISDCELRSLDAISGHAGLKSLRLRLHADTDPAALLTLPALQKLHTRDPLPVSIREALAARQVELTHDR